MLTRGDELPALSRRLLISPSKPDASAGDCAAITRAAPADRLRTATLDRVNHFLPAPRTLLSPVDYSRPCHDQNGRQAAAAPGRRYGLTDGCRFDLSIRTRSGSSSLVGHPKLQNDLRRPTMEEIGHRTTIVSFKGIAGQQRPYIDWLLERRVAEGVVVGEIVTDEALRLLARRLGTPLQIEQYLTRAFEEGLRVGEKSVTAQLIEALLSPQLDELEPRLRQHGYDVPDLAELIDAGQGEIRSLLRSELEPVRSRELTAKLTAAGLPI
jgi:hypothetical protein